MSFEDRFQLKVPLGESQHGTVWSALDSRSHQPVAVSLFDADASDEVRERAQALIEGGLASIRVMTLARVVDAGLNAEGLPYIVTELLADAPSLTERMEKGPAVTADVATRCVIDLLGAVTKLEAAGLVHGDIEPGNVRLIERGSRLSPRLIGLGLNRVTVREGTHALEMPEHLASLSYMAPEQAAGAPGGTSADAFSTMAILYSWITGQPPFRGADAAAVREAAGSAAIPPLGELCEELANTALAATIDKALARDPADRYESAATLTAKLRSALLQTPKARGVEVVVGARTSGPRLHGETGAAAEALPTATPETPPAELPEPTAKLQEPPPPPEKPPVPPEKPPAKLEEASAPTEEPPAKLQKPPPPPEKPPAKLEEASAPTEEPPARLQRPPPPPEKPPAKLEEASAPPEKPSPAVDRPHAADPRAADGDLDVALSDLLEATPDAPRGDAEAAVQDAEAVSADNVALAAATESRAEDGTQPSEEEPSGDVPAMLGEPASAAPIIVAAPTAMHDDDDYVLPTRGPPWPLIGVGVGGLVLLLGISVWAAFSGDEHDTSTANEPTSAAAADVETTELAAVPDEPEEEEEPAEPQADEEVPAEVERVVVSLSGVPDGATVTVDGAAIEGTEVTVEAESHQVEVQAEGFEPWRGTVSAETGSSLAVELVAVETEPEGAEEAEQAEQAEEPEAEAPAPLSRAARRRQARRRARRRAARRARRRQRQAPAPRSNSPIGPNPY